MSYQALTTATVAVRNSGGAFANVIDRLGVIVLLAMGVIMGGATAFAGV